MSIRGEDDETKISESEDSKTEIIISCDRKCLHQGDRICFNDEPRKETVKKIPEDTTNTDSSESYGSVRSGESLFKTFSFDAHDDDPDMEKCVAFWKSILGKNIKPIKCTVLKTKKPKEKQTVKEAPKPNPCDDEESKKLWLSIYKDLQRRNLGKHRLVDSKKCDPSEYIDEDEEKKQDVQDIKNLNNWKSQSQASKIDVKAQVQRTLKVLKGKTSKGDKSISKASSVTTEDRTSQSKSKSVSKTKNTSSLSTPPPTPENGPPSSRKSQEICCMCGCDVFECICVEMAEVMGPEELKTLEQKNKPGPCYPCECSKECVCRGEVKMCMCGCPINNCICDKLEVCVCGCRVDECICSKQNTECPCGCGMEECICEQLFEKSCKCGSADCDCGIIEILNAYLESLNKPSKIQVSMENEDLKLISRQSQTDEERKWLLETTQKQGSYCVICGHFNCYCKSEIQPE